MRKNAFIAIDHITSLNEFKKYSIQSGNLPLTEKDFRTAFKSCGIISNTLFFLEFKNSGLLVKVEGNMWTWKNTSPIHYKTLQDIYSRYQTKANNYSNVHYIKKKREKILKSKEIEEAVNLLKKNGFEIFAPYNESYKKL